MFYLSARMAAAAAVAAGSVSAFCPLSAAVLGPHAELCETSADKPAILVRIEGLRQRAGTLHVQTYGGDPENYFEKGAYLERVDVSPPPGGPIEICMPVPRPGTYAVLVKHDMGGGTFGLNNGGGFSGNPAVSPLDLVLKRKPAPQQVQVAVKGLTRVPVLIRYLQANQ